MASLGHRFERKGGGGSQRNSVLSSLPSPSSSGTRAAKVMRSPGRFPGREDIPTTHSGAAFVRPSEGHFAGANSRQGQGDINSQPTTALGTFGPGRFPKRDRGPQSPATGGGKGIARSAAASSRRAMPLARPGSGLQGPRNWRSSHSLHQRINDRHRARSRGTTDAHSCGVTRQKPKRARLSHHRRWTYTAQQFLGNGGP